MAGLDFSVSYKVKNKGNQVSANFTSTSENDYAETLADLLKFTRNALLTISSDTLREEQEKDFDKQPLTIVDGSYTKRVEDVNPLGKIQYVAKQDLRQIINDTYEAILTRSKILSGEYLHSNVVTYNGRQVANDRASLKTWLDSGVSFSDKDKIRFVNTAPYARKLEDLGVTAQRSNVKFTRKNKKGNFHRSNLTKVPNGVYVLAARSVRNKYKSNTFIKFEYILGSDIGLTGPGRVYKKGKTVGRPYVYPTIVIYAIASGLKNL